MVFPGNQVWFILEVGVDQSKSGCGLFELSTSNSSKECCKESIELTAQLPSLGIDDHFLDFITFEGMGQLILCSHMPYYYARS